MKININLTNKWVYTLVAILSCLILVAVVYSYTDSIGVGHDATSVGVVINGQIKSLQQAINDGNFNGICPDGYELFSSGSSKAECFLIDDWTESAVFSGSGTIDTDEYGSVYYPAGYSGAWTVNAESRMGPNGKRQVRINSCSGYGTPCSTDWTDDKASCLTYNFDVANYGCLVTVDDRYTVKAQIGNIYSSYPLSDISRGWVKGYFGPSTHNNVPKGEHAGSCIGYYQWNSNQAKCKSNAGGYPISRWLGTFTWPGKCSSDGKFCECESGYRLNHRRDLSGLSPDGVQSEYYWYYDCIKN